MAFSYSKKIYATDELNLKCQTKNEIQQQTKKTTMVVEEGGEIIVTLSLWIIKP